MSDAECLEFIRQLPTYCASVLDNFDKSLRKLLYRKPTAGEQSELPLGDSDGLTARKLPQLLPLKWDEDFPGYKIAIQSGLALEEVIKLDDVEIHGFAFEALDGGSCTVRWSANFNQDGRTSGKLCQLIQETVELSLMPPERDAEEMAA
ncbi:hypothetical protein [Rhodanobacter sp. FW106-PBR-LB-2-11]|uniref:hypothetical protein n=1 Tax=Rhodanobacter sp. FW106-PBR-LB-2-11 TaxID=1524463 RepID=UPI0034E44847